MRLNARKMTTMVLATATVRSGDEVARGYPAGDLATAFAHYIFPLENVTGNVDVTAV
jgi:hypothetical protein